MLGLTTPFCFSSSAVQETDQKVRLSRLCFLVTCFFVWNWHESIVLLEDGDFFEHISSEKNINLVLTLYPVLLHLLDFSNRFSQIVSKLFAVLRIGRVEVDEDFNVRSRNGWGQTDSIWIIYRVTLYNFNQCPQITDRSLGKSTDMGCFYNTGACMLQTIVGSLKAVWNLITFGRLSIFVTSWKQ